MEYMYSNAFLSLDFVSIAAALFTALSYESNANPAVTLWFQERRVSTHRSSVELTQDTTVSSQQYPTPSLHVKMFYNEKQTAPGFILTSDFILCITKM